MSGQTLIVVDVQTGFVNEHTRHVVPVVERLQHGYERIYATRFVNAGASPLPRASWTGTGSAKAQRMRNWHSGPRPMPSSSRSMSIAA